MLPMDEAKLGFLDEHAELFDVVCVDGNPAAFLIGLREGIQKYDIIGYTGFSDYYSKYLYIDQIVVDKEYRGKGLARKLYQKAIKHAQSMEVDAVTAAITTLPCNHESLIFHEKMGFCEVGELLLRGGTVRASQQAYEIKQVTENEQLYDSELEYRRGWLRTNMCCDGCLRIEAGFIHKSIRCR